MVFKRQKLKKYYRIYTLKVILTFNDTYCKTLVGTSAAD